MGEAELLPAAVQATRQPSASAAAAAAPLDAPTFDACTRVLRRASLLENMRAALAPDAEAGLGEAPASSTQNGGLAPSPPSTSGRGLPLPEA